MGYAYENTPWSEVPDGEKFAIWEMQTVVRDSFLTDAELSMKLRAIDSMRKEGCVCRRGTCL